ncbi:SDR family NAD(P)-dependent oxidoreductase [Shivajiella indica]|uniref:SDR family NAD(P)-dependent oxidoreductase n=1 Tax=Shivajiella indica TaxID=872115 RepID=A0ABW5B916_9BACT
MFNNFSLENKKILVTGASSGIGKETAINCARNGAEVIFLGRNEDRLKEAIKETGKNSGSFYWKGDLSEEEVLDRLCSKSFPLDGLVLNAGIVKTIPVSFIKSADLDMLFDVNVKSSILLVQKLLKAKKIKKGASIVFVSSISTQKATVGNSMYNATKGAINAFTKSLALELAPKQIRVNAILPGFVNTNLLGGDNDENEDLKKHVSNYPLGRFGEPKDIAFLIQYLLSDASSWMTGSLIPIDGGFSLK